MRLEKRTLERFIRKYYLNGLCKRVRWSSDNGTLRVRTMSADRKLFVGITWTNCARFDAPEIAIEDTSTLLALLASIPSGDIALHVVNAPSGVVPPGEVLVIHDQKCELRYPLAELRADDPAPRMKALPTYNVQITLSEDVIAWVLRGTSGLPDWDFFGLAMSDCNQAIELVLRPHCSSHSAGISIQPETANCKGSVGVPIYFRAQYLREVLAATSVRRDLILKVADAGLASICYSEDEFECEHHLVRMQVVQD